MKGVSEMSKSETQRIVGLVLKAVAVGMSVVSIVMGFLPDVADVDTHITLLSIGLAALAVAALQKEE
jgi:putative Mn2+ efflux pump MntP